jgi:hypothetical protein
VPTSSSSVEVDLKIPDVTAPVSESAKQLTVVDAQGKKYAQAKLKEIDILMKEAVAKKELASGKWPPDVPHPVEGKKRSVSDLKDHELKGKR